MGKVHAWSLGLPKFWIWSLAFHKYTDGPCSLLKVVGSVFLTCI
ncbi:hypothetical protein HanPI659440_Chr00c11g0723681 [Helianthus annuus]|nr:hypothetical protein HanPI659440_Chr00c11g0723681 [Helianthus annuus]